SALGAVKASSARERGQLEAVARLTRLFDVGRTFTSTLDLDALKELIVNRVRSVLEVENVYLWLLDDEHENLEIAAAAGPAAEAVADWKIPANDNLAGHVVTSNRGYVVEDIEEIDGWETRLDAQAGLAFVSLAASPVAFEDEAPIGAIEVINKENGQILDKDDLAFLGGVAPPPPPPPRQCPPHRRRASRERSGRAARYRPGAQLEPRGEQGQLHAG